MIEIGTPCRETISLIYNLVRVSILSVARVGMKCADLVRRSTMDTRWCNVPVVGFRIDFDFCFSSRHVKHLPHILHMIAFMLGTNCVSLDHVSVSCSEAVLGVFFLSLLSADDNLILSRFLSKRLNLEVDRISHRSLVIDNDSLWCCSRNLSRFGILLGEREGDQVLQQLSQYGIEHIETIRIPEDIAYNKIVKVGDTKSKNKIKGFSFLEFSMHSVAAVTYQRLKKPDVVLGRDVSAKVSFEQSAKPSNDEDVPQVNRVHMAGLAKD
ncbi:hypothetical protein Tco_0775504 [Tanacetum coccineum]